MKVMRQIIPIFAMMMMVAAGGCKFSKGDQYLTTVSGDSLLYTIAAKGKGERISKKASLLKIRNEIKGNQCIIRYFSDSIEMQHEKSLLLMNIRLPDIKDDMLSKGYFGTFTSKQSVNLLLVSYDDFDRFFNSRQQTP